MHTHLLECHRETATVGAPGRIATLSLECRKVLRIVGVVTKGPRNRSKLILNRSPRPKKCFETLAGSRLHTTLQAKLKWPIRLAVPRYWGCRQAGEVCWSLVPSTMELRKSQDNIKPSASGTSVRSCRRIYAQALMQGSATDKRPLWEHRVGQSSTDVNKSADPCSHAWATRFTKKLEGDGTHRDCF
jgi:hypothetical protein